MLIKSFGRHFAMRALIIFAVQVAFIVAKLTGLLTWHWLLVFAPFIFTGVILAIVLCVATLLMIMSDG